MTDELVQRLRVADADTKAIFGEDFVSTQGEAADEIERLRAEVTRLDHGWNEAIQVSNGYAEQLGIAESALAALRKRVEESATAIPVMQSSRIVLCDFSENAGPFIASAAKGGEKRFALVVLGEG